MTVMRWLIGSGAIVCAWTLAALVVLSLVDFSSHFPRENQIDRSRPFKDGGSETDPDSGEAKSNHVS